MDPLQQGILILIRSAVTGKACPLPEDFDLEAAYTQILRHGVIPMAYEGAVRCGIAKDLPVMQKLFQGYYRSLVRSEGQLRAIAQLCRAFEEAEVDYLPLKGCNLKVLYPKPEMRLMGDADILIRAQQYERIRPIMEALGYKEGLVGPYDYTWESPSLHAELHWQLAAPRDRDYDRYFGDGWKRARLATHTHYVYSDEDELIYLFMHFTKHYRDSGIGLKHAVDLWVYHHAKPALDHDYLKAELEKLQLWVFYQNILQMLEVWFHDAPWDEKSAFITDFIFDSGAFGKREVFAVSVTAREIKEDGSAHKARLRRGMAVLFPDADTLKGRYPILEKYPCLLPFFWPIRWLTALLFRRQNIQIQKKELSIATPDKIETYQQAMQYVGLDFNFEE